MKRFLSILLAVMMILSSVSYAAPAAVGTMDNASEVLTLPEAELVVPWETADLAADDTWYDLEKGTLLFNMDFDSDNSGNAVAATAYDGVSLGSYSAGSGELVSGLGRLNPDVAGNYDVGFRYTTSGSAAIGDENGNKYLSLNTNGNNQVSLYMGNVMTKTGKYVIEYDYKVVLDSTSSAVFSSTECHTPSAGGHTGVQAGVWITETVETEISSVPSYIRLRWLTGSSTMFSTNDKILFDNVKVWYYDESVDYNEKVNGSTGDGEETESEWANTEKGYRLFVVDFEETADFSAITSGRADSSPSTAGVAVADVGRVNPNYTVNARINIKAGSGASVTGTDNKYLTVSSAGDSLIFSQIYVGDGTYVFEFETNNGTVSDIRGSYNEAALPTSETVDSTWNRLSHTAADMTEALSTSCSSYGTDNIRFLYSTKPTMYDNIVVYYQPTGWTAPSEGGDEPDTPVVEDVWEDETKGTKLFTIDFEAKNDGTAVDSSSWDTIKDRLDNNPSNGELITDIGRVNPDIADASSYRISFNYIDNSKTEIITEGDNKYLSVASDASHGDISLYIGGLYDGEGEYIIETSYKFIQKGTNTVDRIRYETLALEYKDSSYLSRGEWVDLSETHEHSSCSHADVNRTRFTTAGYNNNPFSADDRIYIDNITVYYKAPGTDEPGEEDSEWTDAAYGDKLFNIDFATKNDGSAVTSSDISTFASGRLDSSASAGVAVSGVGKVNPEYASIASRVGLKDVGVVSLADGAIAATTGSSTGNMSLYFRDTYVGPGTYTYVFDYNTASEKTFTINSGYCTTGTLTTEAIDDTWTRVTYVVPNIDETNYLATGSYTSNFIRFYSAGASAEGKFVYDNLAVYYKNTVAQVTVKSNGNANVADTTVNVDKENGDTVGNIVAKVDRSASTKELLGASLTANGELLAADYVVKPSEVTEIYLIWGDDIVVDDTPWFDEGYGTLLFNIDWDGTLSTSSQTRWADVRAAGASTNPDWKCFEKCYFMWGTEDIGGSNWVPASSPLIVAEANGNRYYTEPHNSTYNSWSIYSTFDGDWANWADYAGVFTITYKIKTIGNITVNNLFIDPQTVKNHSTVKQNIRLFATELPDSSGWTTVTYQVDLSDYDVSEGESLGHVLLYAQTNESSAVSGAYICYDDVKVYYKPSTVNVTLKPGTNLEVNETTVEVSSKGMLVSDLLSLVNTEDTTMLATGITSEDGSKKYALTDTVVFDADTTVYITWEANDWMDNEKGMLIQRADFEGAMQTTSINRWPAATALGATINPDYSFSGVTGLQFTVADTGIAFDESSLWIPADYDVTENGNTYFEVPTANKAYGSTQQLTCISMYAMGSGASQYQYQGAGTYTITGKIKYGTDIQNATLEIRPNLYNGEGGLSGGYNYKFEDMTAGEWNDFSVTWSTAEDSQYGLGSVQFYLFHDILSSKSTVAFDDIMLYYKPFTAEVTLRANNNPVAKDVVLSGVSTTGITVEELISNIRTPLGGMDLVGLAYDKAGTNMLEGTVVIGGDARFFMIWKESDLDPNAPISENVNSIRTDDPIGMRFRSYITTSVYESATQVGWIFTRYDLLEAKGINPYDFYLDTDVTKVKGYNKDTDGTDKVFGTDDSNTFITVVAYNIPEAHYETTLVARPYTVVDGVTYYGYPIERSICEVAEAIRDGGYAGCSNDQLTYIKSILEVCGKSTEPTVAE